MFRQPLIPIILLAMLAVPAVCRAQVPARGVRLDAATMKAALRTAAPEEDGFVDRVVRLANANRLPRSLVRSTFLWARKKPRWKFQYFRMGLILRAHWRGIRL